MGELAKKRGIIALVKDKDLGRTLAGVRDWPSRWVVNPLISCLCLCDDLARWHAVTAVGDTMARLAAEEMEAARIVMRRFMWMLNDESGGIGWGVPEAMAESMACHPGLAAEYAHILVAYMREDASYLELEALQRGLLWGAARLAGQRPEVLRQWKAECSLPQYLGSADAGIRGHACLALARLGTGGGAADRLRALLDDPASFESYDGGVVRRLAVRDCAALFLS